MEKVNVCFVAPLPPPYGGIANWSAMIRRYFDAECKDSLKYSFVNIAPKKRSTEGRGILNRVFGGGFGMLKNVKELKRNIKADKPDCIHITTSGSLSLIRDYYALKTAAKAGIKSAYHIRFGRIPEVLKSNGREGKLFRKCARLASTIIAIDNRTYQALLNTEFGNKSVLIPNPIYMEELPQPLEEKKNYISFVGWVIKEKGVEELLSAWEDICRNNQNHGWRLHLIGPYKEEYMDALKQRFDFSGVDVLGELKHSDALVSVNAGKGFVLPSYSEGFPNAVVEAMALGEHIAASKVGAIPEMLSGNCGELVESKNVEDLKNGLLTIIETSDNRTASNAKNKASEEYNIKKIVKRYMEVWRNAL